jgi:hypothetical protein
LQVKLILVTSDPVARYLATRGHKLERRERLRTMSPGEVFNAAVRVYRQLGWTYLRLTLVPSTFCLAGIAFVLEYVLPSFLVTRHAHNVNAQLGEAATSLGLALFVGAPLFLIGFSYTCALVIQLTSDYILGNPLSPEKALNSARSAFPALMVVALREMALASAGVVVGALVLGLGAFLSNSSAASGLGSTLFAVGILGVAIGFGLFLYIFSIHSLAPAIIQIEGLNGVNASKRSAYLLKPHLKHPSGTPNFLLCMMYIGFAGLIEWSGFTAILELLQAGEHVQGFVSGIPFEGVFVSAYFLVPPFITIWTLLPIYATCVTLVYYERRIRLEGLDIEILAAETQRLGASNRFDV